MLVGDLLEPLPDIPGIQLVLSLVSLLFFKGRRLVQDYLALFRTAVHANCPLCTGTEILDVLDYLLELPAAHSMLQNDVVYTVPVIVLLGLLRVGRMGLRGIEQ